MLTIYPWLCAGSFELLQEFSDYINKIHEKNKFSLDVQNKGKQINFLELTIYVNNNKFDFEIFRKPTQTESIIHNQSQHNFPKKGAFNSYIHYLVSLLLTIDSFNKELSSKLQHRIDTIHKLWINY